MKLSFSIPSSKNNPNSRTNNLSDSVGDGSNKRKQHPNHPNDEEESKEFLKEFDSSKPQFNSGSNNVKAVIPPLQNTNDWRLTNQIKKMKNLTLPLSESSNGQLHFELDTSSLGDNDPGSHMAYGLNLRQPTSTKADDEKDLKQDSVEDLSRNRSSESVLLQKLKDDLNKLPEHKGMEEYEDLPVEDFGVAILSGYGWHEGKGIGRNTKEDVKVKQFEKRTGKEGLGFFADAPNINTDSLPKKKEQERPEELRIKDGFSVGMSVRIIAGRDLGLKGRILERVGNDFVVLKLSRTEEKVKVRVNDIVKLGSKEEDRCLRGLRNAQGSGKDRDCSNKNKMSTEGSGRRDGIQKVEVVRNINNNGIDSGKKEKENKKKQIPWLTSHIRVRIISKDFKRGRFYLKKGKVLDVIDPITCDIAMDDSEEIIQGVSQEYLETAIPRRGGNVVVLYGKHKGVYGSLVEKNLDREVGVVRDADSHELLSVGLEQMAEYVGDPSYLGY